MVRHLARVSATATVCALGATLPAAAATDRPPIQPTRDVVVEYKIADQSAPANMPHPDRIKVYFSANGTRMRVEPSGQPMYMVMDRDAKRMEIVMPPQHSYMEMPYDAKKVDSFSAAEGASFTKKGSDTVAGLSCTVWEVKSQQNTGTVCMTDDGVMLRAQGQGADPQHSGGMEAVSVVYGAQPAALFAPPADYQKMDRPRGMPPGAPGAPGGRPPG